MSRRACSILAQWTIGESADHVYVERPRLVQASMAAIAAATPTSEPAPVPADIDAATFAALQAWRDGAPMIVDADGIAWAERIPLLIDHAGTRLAELEVVREGDTLTATGLVDAVHADALARLGHVSDHLEYRRARIVDLPPVPRFVRATETRLLELSATDNPHSSGTMLLVGTPEDIPDEERHRVVWADGVTFTAPKERFRALSERGEAEYQAECARREAEAS